MCDHLVLFELLSDTIEKPECKVGQAIRSTAI